MHIAHVCHNYYPSKGGPQYTMKHLSEQFVHDYNDDVTVLTTDSYYGPESKLYKRIKPAKEIVSGVKINRYPFWRWHYPLITYGSKIKGKITGSGLPYQIARWRYDLYSPSLHNAMDNIECDVIMATTGIYHFCDYPDWRKKTKHPKPFVLYGALHIQNDPGENDPGLRRAKFCDCYIANTEYERQILISRGVNALKIVTIGTGVNPDSFKPNDSEVLNFKERYNIKPGETVIGFIGRLVKGKGVGDLLSAFRKLYANNKSLKLLLAGGTTEYIPEIKNARDKEHLPIILIENFDESYKAVLYNVMDIFVMASQSESFGVVYLEAWSTGKPVVSSRLAPVETLLTEGKDSLMFRLNDIDEMVLQINKLVENKSLQVAMGLEGYKKVKEHFTWPMITKKYRDAYLLGIENFKINNY